MMKFKIHKATIYQDAFDKEIGTSITAYIENGILSIIQVDWGGITHEYSRDGEIESFLIFDLPNMKKFAGTLHAKGDEMLAKKIAEHFGRHKSFAKYEIQKYCDKREIMYKTHVYY
ncbi:MULTISPECIES: hypothetical protein [Butyricimonas]|uniref:hypothetical protein n=1 Tax=Butyricimonas TaxID=574697 RepID=UPI0007FB1FBF|nr:MULTISPECIES: hypothetical protein [Butyricimonas]